ncbi:TPA: SIR2 family protein [Aeromonas veronii]
MDIFEFVAKFKNHPVLFVGTGMSLRYLKNSFSWDKLLEHVASQFNESKEYYLDIKADCSTGNGFDFASVALHLERDFNEALKRDRHGSLKWVNDIFYENMERGTTLSRFKIYITEILKSIDYVDEKKEELGELKKARKNIGSVITTNYDTLIEEIFDFNPLVGNDILLSNPYGSVYKIHGCVSAPDRIIITSDDYSEFETKYELIRAQLLSLFIHNPIIFIGYGVGDDNIKSILKTIFSYVDVSSENAERIRENFLLVEHQHGVLSTEISDHDIDIQGQIIRINKIKTDNFSAIYQALSDLALPVSAMDIRKVQNVWKTITTGGAIKVSITEDLENLENDKMVIAVGSEKTIKYDFITRSEMMVNYFTIIDEANGQLLETLNKQTIQANQFFPIYAFGEICPRLNRVDELKIQQKEKVLSYISTIKGHDGVTHTSIPDVEADQGIPRSNKINIISWLYFNDYISPEDIKNFLLSYDNKNDTAYRRLLCIYDLKVYGHS